MQVFFDNHIFQKQSHGGISRYICDLALALAQTNQIKVILFGGWNNNAFLSQLPQHPNLRLIYRPRRKRFKINRITAWLLDLWQRIVFFRAIKRDPDTLYHSTYFKIDPFIHKKARATVVTVYDMMAELFPQDKQAQHRLLKQAAAQKAQGIIAISQSTRKDLIHFYPFTEKKIAVIYLGSLLDQRLLSQAQEPAFQDEPYFLMLGERRGYKNGFMVIKAFALLAKNLPDVHLVLCGGNKADPREQNLIADEQIADRVHYLQPEDAMLAGLIGNATALVYPSRYEGFGLPVLEAMQQGCPVITTRLSSLPEVAGDAAIYVEPDSPEETAQAMQRLVDQPQERRAYIEKGYQQAKRFSVAKMATETLAVYQKFI